MPFRSLAGPNNINTSYRGIINIYPSRASCQSRKSWLRNNYLYSEVFIGLSCIFHREDKGGGRACILVLLLVYKVGGGGSRTSKRPIEGIFGMCRLKSYQ